MNRGEYAVYNDSQDARFPDRQWPHAVVIAPVVTRIEMLRIARTYELCIMRRRPVTLGLGAAPSSEPERYSRLRDPFRD
jgi:hypothetical protein